MDVLEHARAVHWMPLVTTFRAHPALNGLPNAVSYMGSLVSGADPNSRRMLLDRMSFPDRSTTFLFLDVAGNSERALSKSHHNEAEASVCTTIIDRLLGKGIQPKDICIICFYKKQFRRISERAAEYGVDITAVDSVQGRENEIVIC